uniref:Putative phage integrase family protein n=1 Tax=Magnetococcus massalia (strain MO-1) TaxID=451514 RepID=A0A1S7LGI8_MAGMO|nr:Putative phage integrase family protein [Candidatus Magnetococcus massalia]
MDMNAKRVAQVTDGYGSMMTSDSLEPLDYEIIEQLLQTNAANNATAERTHRARSSDTKRFAQWCAQHGHQALPASAKTLTRFIEEMIEEKALATVRRYVSSISTLHNVAQHPNPTQDPMVREALRRVADRPPRAAKGTKPISREMVQRMVNASLGTLRDQRDVALLMVAYDTMFRRTEVVALDVANLHFGRDGFATVTAPVAFSSEEQGPATRCIAPDTTRAVEGWMRAANIAHGPLFRSIDRAGVIGDRLSDRGLVRAFKRLARQAGLDPNGVSGLSARVGAARDMMREGFQVSEVMQAGGWRSPVMVTRYRDLKSGTARNQESQGVSR